MKKSLYPIGRFAVLLCLTFGLMDFDDAYAYIDPGTTGVAFSALGYVVSMALLGIALFMRPVRSLMRSIFSRLTGKGKPVDDNGDGR